MSTRQSSSQSDRATSMAADEALPNGIDPADPEDPSKTLPSSLNILEVILGSLLIKPWYSSDWYPEELLGHTINRLFVCQWCFKYTKELVPFEQHLKVCPLHSSPPGTLRYSKDHVSIYEFDGSDHKLYAQNLSLFAKLFLHVKSVFYDVSAFKYYLLVLEAPHPDIVNPSLGDSTRPIGSQVVGFFSKEKMSWDNNNLSCICIFPPWQKKGLAQVLIAASYELGRKEGRMGGPEKPFSTHGYAAYMHYWSKTLARTILTSKSKKITTADLHKQTCITTDDIQNTLNAMGALEQKTRGGCKYVINKARVKAWVEMNKVNLKNPIDDRAFVQDTDKEEESEEDDDEDDDDSD